MNKKLATATKKSQKTASARAARRENKKLCQGTGSQYPTLEALFPAPIGASEDDIFEIIWWEDYDSHGSLTVKGWTGVTKMALHMGAYKIMRSEWGSDGVLRPVETVIDLEEEGITWETLVFHEGAVMRLGDIR